MNPMKVPRCELIASTIRENIGKDLTLDEWCKVINDHLPSPKRMTKSSVTSHISMLRRKKEFNVTKKVKNLVIIYQFEVMAVGDRVREQINQIN